jgi:hypothetical protein
MQGCCALLMSETRCVDTLCNGHRARKKSGGDWLIYTAAEAVVAQINHLRPLKVS